MTIYSSAGIFSTVIKSGLASFDTQESVGMFKFGNTLAYPYVKTLNLTPYVQQNSMRRIVLFTRSSLSDSFCFPVSKETCKEGVLLFSRMQNKNP